MTKIYARDLFSIKRSKNAANAFDALFPFPRIPTREWIPPVVARFSHYNLPKQDNPLNV